MFDAPLPSSQHDYTGLELLDEATSTAAARAFSWSSRASFWGRWRF